ncbi:mitogen-activated protein kinase kinase kinase 7-like, partial [Actinia tenebrosa]
CRLAEDYIKIQAEMSKLLEQRAELEMQLQEYEKEQQMSAPYVEQFAILTSEKENLLLLHKNLKTQLEYLRRPRTAF